MPQSAPCQHAYPSAVSPLLQCKSDPTTLLKALGWLPQHSGQSRPHIAGSQRHAWDFLSSLFPVAFPPHTLPPPHCGPHTESPPWPCADPTLCSHWLPLSCVPRNPQITPQVPMTGPVLCTAFLKCPPPVPSDVLARSGAPLTHSADLSHSRTLSRICCNQFKFPSLLRLWVPEGQRVPHSTLDS